MKFWIALIGILLIGVLVVTVPKYQDMQNKKQVIQKHNTDSLSLVQTVYKEGMTLPELLKYFHLIQSVNTKDSAKLICAPQHYMLINSFCDKYLDTMSKLLDSVVRNKNLVAFPDSYLRIIADSANSDYDAMSYPRFATIITMCNTDSVSKANKGKPTNLKAKSKAIEAKYKNVDKIIDTRLKQLADIIYQAQMEAQATERRSYGERLRNKFLDDGTDIKVLVYGTNNTSIKFTFALFNDVWSHKMSQGDLIDEIKSKGFKRFEMSDGYDWGKYWTF